MKKSLVVKLVATVVISAMVLFPTAVMAAEIKELKEEKTELQHKLFELNNYIMKEIDQE